jgi:hypothetical protein
MFRAERGTRPYVGRNTRIDVPVLSPSGSWFEAAA